MKKKRNNQSGFALITLLVFTVIAITIITAATLVLTTNILAGSNAQNGLNAYYVAESGVEDASLLMLRNPLLDTTYTLPTDDGTASVVIHNNGGTGSTITSTATIRTATKTIRATTTYSGGKETFTSWAEIP